MRAVVIPEVNADWVVQELETPKPGPGEVLIRVRASGLCRNEIASSRGQLTFPSISPAVPGHEPVGSIVDAGPGVTSRLPYLADLGVDAVAPAGDATTAGWAGR